MYSKLHTTTEGNITCIQESRSCCVVVTAAYSSTRSSSFTFAHVKVHDFTDCHTAKLLSCDATIVMATPLDMIVAAPTHHDWWYMAEEHVKIKRASGISDSKYDLALLDMYSRYYDRFAPSCYHRDETCDLHPSYEQCDMVRARLQDFNHENCCPLPFF
jgi:hypothetical protein